MSDIKPYTEKKGDFLYLKIPMREAWKFMSYDNWIEKCLKHRRPVPLRVYKKMMGLLRIKGQDEQAYYDQAIEALTKSVCEYFKDDKEYYFSVTGTSKDIRGILMPDGPEKIDGVIYYPKDYDEAKKKKKPGKYIKITYSFENMIEPVLITVFHHVFFSDKKNTKEDILKACYANIMEYTKKDKKVSDKITHYKASVISGYIAMRFGHTLSKDLSPQVLENRAPTNRQIYNAVKHCTDLLNSLKKKKK